MPIVHFSDGVRRVVIGTLDVDAKEFSKKVSWSKHLYRVLDAWGMDAAYFNDVLLPNEYTIKVVDVEKKVRYTVSAKDFKKHGTHKHFKTGNVDHGAQIFLPRSRWAQEPYVMKVQKRKKKIGYLGSLPKL